MNTSAQRDTWARILFLALGLAAAGCDSKDDEAAVRNPDGGEIDIDSAVVDQDPSKLGAYRDGDEVFLRLPKNKKLVAMTCSNAVSIEKHTADGWVPLQDDRPPSYNSPGAWVDGKYQPPAQNLGCDYQTCAELEKLVGSALEYVKTGMKAAPDDAPPAAQSPVDVIESRSYPGELRVVVVYSESDECFDEANKVSVELTVPAPAKGVCCPIGSRQCSSEGPGGGWSASIDACPEWSMGFDVAYRVQKDSHGCDTLVEDLDECCGCTDEDGGI